MKKSVYRELLELAWSKDSFVLKGRKGTMIYKEERENHIQDMRMVTKDGEFPLLNHDYLVFEINEKEDKSLLEGIYHHHGVTVKETSYGTEIACHHPQVFSNGILSNLEEKGYITRTWHTKSHEKGEGSYYVNAKGWQLLYNFVNMMGEFIYTAIQRLHSKMSKEENSNEIK